MISCRKQPRLNINILNFHCVFLRLLFLSYISVWLAQKSPAQLLELPDNFFLHVGGIGGGGEGELSFRGEMRKAIPWMRNEKLWGLLRPMTSELGNPELYSNSIEFSMHEALCVSIRNGTVAL